MSVNGVHQTQADAPGAALFEPYQVRDVVARNRVVISPMQQYSAIDGHANEWRLVHLARFALGGAGITPSALPVGEGWPVPAALTHVLS